MNPSSNPDATNGAALTHQGGQSPRSSGASQPPPGSPGSQGSLGSGPTRVDPDRSETTRRPAWQIVALREIAVKARDKNFLVSLGITLLLVAGSFGVQIWLAGKTSTQTVAVVKGQQTSGASAGALVDAAEKAGTRQRP